LLSDRELCDLLKREDPAAWRYILEKIVDQEKRSPGNNRKRADWGVPLESLLGQLYEEMVGKGKLAHYQGSGSLVGWLRSYLRGYLQRQNPNLGRTTSLDAPDDAADGEASRLTDEISFRLSEERRGDAYGDEGLPILRQEQWRIVQKCFKDLWERNSMQAYVMLLKLRFHMSSVEIKERLGISSTANVDQLFARAVKKMREERGKYVD
jgi:DNA-directed RNA polymerase specialized sigma24 family protein